MIRRRLAALKRRIPKLTVRSLYRPPTEIPRAPIEDVDDLLSEARSRLGIRPATVFCVGPKERFTRLPSILPDSQFVHLPSWGVILEPGTSLPAAGGRDLLLIRCGRLSLTALLSEPLLHVARGCDLVAWQTDVFQCWDETGYLSRANTLLQAEGFCLLELNGGRYHHLWQPTGRLGQLDLVFVRSRGTFQPWLPAL